MTRLVVKKGAELNGVGKPRIGRYAMVTDEALEHLDTLIKSEPSAARLLSRLIRHLPEGTSGVVVASRNTLAEVLGVSVPTITRATTVLIKAGYVQRIRISGAWALAINARVAWRGDRDGIQHAAFSATVIASSSEQTSEGLNPVPMRHVPISLHDEHIVGDGRGSKPPSQTLIPNMPPTFATAAAGIDPETGEIIAPSPGANVVRSLQHCSP